MKTSLSIVEGGSGSPPSGLNLELGRGSSAHEKLDCFKCFGFTISQLQELQLQALINKYIQAGLPVPYHLLLPIWKSLDSSCGNPRFLGCSPPLYLDPKKGTMDGEPWRCRRTDGKKWRCGKEALPDHKYCERHIHRGRHRSRKPVEAASHQHTISSSSSTASANTTNGDFLSSSDTSLSISLPMNSSSSSIIFSPKSVLQDHQGTN